MEKINNYTAVALQINCNAVNHCKSREDSSKIMMRKLNGIKDSIKLIDGFNSSFNGSKAKLFVLPEYFLTSFPLGESIAKWREIAAIDMDGPEYDALGSIAEKQDCFISGNVYESDPNFPDLYFQTCFLIGPNGNVLLRYRRLISLFAPSPYDVWDKYLDIYGLDSIFPIADTEIGRLACVASEEILYPEISRCLTMRGMELLCHSTSEVGSPMLTPKEICRRARAVENMCYVVSSNTASIKDTPLPAEATSGMSKVVDYKGVVLAESNPGESYTANAIIDIEGLRMARRRSGMTNVLSRQPNKIYAQQYSLSTSVQPNQMLDNGEVKIPDRKFFLQRQRSVIEQLQKDGVI